MELTPKQFLEIEIDKGMSAENPQFRELAKRTIDQLKGYNIKTVLDYGAGTGVYANAAYEAGYQVSVYEIWKEHRDYIAKTFPHLEVLSITPQTDAMLFIEVAEHMKNRELDRLMLSVKPQYILFSSTPNKNPKFDAAWGHINVKPPHEWDAFFSIYGYFKMFDLSYPTPWAKLYVLNR